MKTTTEVLWSVKRRLAAAALTVALAGSGAFATDVHLDMLKTRTDTYTDVTVYGRSKTDVFIRHSRGIANIKLASLDTNTIAQLNGEKPSGPPGGLAATEASATGEVNGDEVATTAPALASKLDAQLRQQVMSNMAALKALSEVNVSPTVVGLVLGVMFVIYLFFCHCLKLICLKAGSDPGILIWLPILKEIPLLRAAGMSGWWFLSLFIPFVYVIVQIVWCFKIAQVRGKSAWTAIGLLLPVTNVIALLYLAFSDGKKVKPPSYQKVTLAAGPLAVEA